MSNETRNAENARRTYEVRRAQCQELLGAISERLELHAEAGQDWAGSGSLAHVADKLNEVLLFLGGSRL